MRKFAKTPTYQTIEILGQSAIYTDYRIEHASVPQGFYLYEIRHSDEDWGIPCQLARNIAVNFYGTIITNTPIQLPPDGLLDFDYEQFYFTDEAFNTLAKFMEAHPAENKDLIEIAAAKESEYALMFSQSEQDDCANGCIGHLRGDFGTDGNEFHTTWWPHQNDALNTHEFKSDIDRVVNWLREGFAPLKDRNTMRRFCELRGRVLNAEEAILPPCGFSIHTKNYQYMGIGAARIYLAPASNAQSRSLLLFLVQLAFNFFWSIIFFNLQAFGFAFLWLIALWVLILLMILSFRKVDKPAAWLQIPYLLWVTFAAYLNLGVWLLNR